MTRVYPIYWNQTLMPHVPAPEKPRDLSAPTATNLAAAEEHEPMLYCPVCSLRLAQRKCKLFCQQCGYFMSCADYI